MKRFRLLLLVLVCQGCLTDQQALSGSLPEQRFFFEMTYANDAWVKQHHGVYIDSQGEAYAYNYSHAVWQPADPTAYTEDELLQKFESEQERIGTIDAATFRRMTALIERAARGQLSDPINECNDAGITTYLAYQFDRETGIYLPVVLYQTGDWAQKNRSQEAAILFEWLFTFDGWQPGACLP